MINFAICDDLQEEREYATSFITRYCTENNLSFQIDTFSSGEEFLNVFRKGKYAVIFLDVYMDNLDGIQTAKAIRESDSSVDIIFTTTSQDHAIDGFSVNAKHYLVKPYTYEIFLEGIERCHDNIFVNKNIVEFISNNITRIIDTRKIMYIEVNHKLATVHALTDDYNTYTSLDEFDKILPKRNFFRVHRSFIVNMDFIDKYYIDYIQLKNDAQISLSRSKKQEFRKHYAEYLSFKIRG